MLISSKSHVVSKAFLRSSLLVWAVLFAQPANAEVYGVINITSRHIDAVEDFNENNFGLGVGYYYGKRWHYGLEIGFFENSYNDLTTYGYVFMDHKVATISSSEIRMGGFAGFFKYPNLVPIVEPLGLPVINEHVFQGGLMVSAELQNEWGINVKAVPAGGKPTLVLTFQLTKKF